MQRFQILISFILAFCLSASLCFSQELQAWVPQSPFWSIQSPHNKFRWIIIHDLNQTAHDTETYHIEILEREIGSKPWEFRHLRKHMAITTSALKASVLNKLKSGAVYPESFNDAYAQWVKSHRPICSQSISECIKSGDSY